MPPPPEKSSLAAVAVKVSGSADLNESVAGKIIERRCVALDRFVRLSQLQVFLLGYICSTLILGTSNAWHGTE